MNHKDIFEVTHKGETYYYNPELSIADCIDLQIKGDINSFEHGINGSLNSSIFFKADPKIFDKNTTIGTVKKYPALFESFWKNYHKQRRVGKRKAHKEWVKISKKDQESLPLAAKNYTNNIIAKSSYNFMKHPETFISSGLYEDYFEKEEIEDMIELASYFNDLFTQRFKFKYQLTQHEKMLLENDINNIGLKKIKELCYIFFKDIDPNVKAANRNENFSYNVFSALMKGVLGITKKKVPKTCTYCGVVGGHKADCPTVTERKLKEAEEKKEVAEAKAENIDLMNMFRSKIGRK